MNHKLHNTILASAVVGAALMFGLLSARPLPDHAAAGKAAHPSIPEALASADARREFGMDFGQARFQPERAGSPGQALATASVLLAGSMVEATVASVLDDLVRTQAAARRGPVAGKAGERQDASETRQHRRRGTLATPYFSTARGPGRSDAE